jgi:cutinase
LHGCKFFPQYSLLTTLLKSNFTDHRTEQHFEALASVVGTDKRTVRGIDYLASVQGFPAGGDANGSKLMAQLVSQAKSQCLNSKVVVSGSSQGGQLVHNAANLLNASTAAVASSGMTVSVVSYFHSDGTLG